MGRVVTRRDYNLIAGAVRAAIDARHPLLNLSPAAARTFAIADVVDALADALATDNPRFDADRFHAAIYGGTS